MRGSCGGTDLGRVRGEEWFMSVIKIHCMHARKVSKNKMLIIILVVVIMSSSFRSTGAYWCSPVSSSSDYMPLPGSPIDQHFLKKPWKSSAERYSL